MASTPSNGKPTRSQKIKDAASKAALKVVDSTPTNVNTVTVDTPFIEGADGKQLNVFDVNDSRVRLMFILEHMGTMEDGSAEKTLIHTIRWNCDAFVAHSVAIDGVGATRTQELEALRAARAAMELEASNK